MNTASLRGGSAVVVLGEERTVQDSSVFRSVERMRAAGLAVICEQDYNVALASQKHDDYTSVSNFVFLAGVGNPREILIQCFRLRAAGRHVTLLVDALEIHGRREVLLTQLEEEGFQLARVEGAISLSKSQSTFVYAYSKAEVAASAVAICARTERVVLVQRACDPFRGFYSLPGGFLRPMLETLEECAARELKEETGLEVDARSLQLITVRSSVERDNRGHVIDHSYLATISQGVAEHRMYAADDASKVCLVPLEEAMKMTLAADHNIILKEAVQLYRSKQSRLKQVWLQLSSAVPAALQYRRA
jgi:8-oxo-dGTP diphosphatase